MSRTARKNDKSGFFHIMVQGINKEKIFKKEKDKKQFLFFMKKYYCNYKIKIIAYCVMDNHVHLIIHSEDINEISNYMHKINGVYAIYYNDTNKRIGYVFRDRYKSQFIYDRDYLFKCIKYVHMNPVKAKMVNSEKEYKYSSYNDFVSKKGYIDESIIELVFIDKDYLKIFNSVEVVDIEIIDVDNDNENLKNAINKYIIENNTSIESIINNKNESYEFFSMLISKGYKQNKIAKILNISPSKISKIINKKI